MTYRDEANDATDSVSEMGHCIVYCHQVESLLADSKNKLSSEILRRVEMENQVQTLKEQLELQRNISDQVKHTHTDTHRMPLGGQSCL